MVFRIDKQIKMMYNNYNDMSWNFVLFLRMPAYGYECINTNTFDDK